jgi:hypothetical protein
MYFGIQTMHRDGMRVGGVRLSPDPTKHPAVWDWSAALR